MSCILENICGGCKYRELGLDKYQALKRENILQNFPQLKEIIFIADGQRRRANFSFSYSKKKLNFGFYQKQSHILVDIDMCASVTALINQNLSVIKDLVLELCQSSVEIKNKKKIEKKFIIGGEVFVLNADNGLSLSIDTGVLASLEHKLIASEFLAKNKDFVQVSINDYKLENIAPIINNSGVSVFVEPSSFLQASQNSERILLDIVEKYVGSTTGKIADLFCGLGTFSYALAKNKNNKIVAIDSSDKALDLFQKTINKNMISNIKIKKQNLFKYPLDAQELQKFDVIVFDPPFAGASSQVAELVKAEDKIKKIIAISCNPYSFIKDAKVLEEGGYILKEINFVDQFIYSDHIELAALFEGA